MSEVLEISLEPNSTLEVEPSTDPSPKPHPRTKVLVAPPNPAIARCCDAFNRTHAAVLAACDKALFAGLEGSKAYEMAMPPLSGPQNIRDFIACVTYGMLVNTITVWCGTKLLYAAQVAHNTLPKRTPRPRKSAVSTTCA